MSPDFVAVLADIDNAIRSTALNKYGIANATAFQNQVGWFLGEQGYEVTFEYRMRSTIARFRWQYIDLVITHPICVAIELDWGKPRMRSLRKLALLKKPGLRVAAVRSFPRRVVTWEVT